MRTIIYLYEGQDFRTKEKNIKYLPTEKELRAPILLYKIFPFLEPKLCEKRKYKIFNIPKKIPTGRKTIQIVFSESQDAKNIAGRRKHDTIETVEV